MRKARVVSLELESTNMTTHGFPVGSIIEFIGISKIDKRWFDFFGMVGDVRVIQALVKNQFEWIDGDSDDDNGKGKSPKENKTPNTNNGGVTENKPTQGA
jgi:hypothetical protein